MLGKLLLLLLVVGPINGYKILVYNPKMGHSHVNYMSQITRLLVEAGHDVYVLSSNIDHTLKDPYHVPGKIYYTKPSDIFSQHATDDGHIKRIWESSNDNVFSQVFRHFMKGTRAQGLTLIENEELAEYMTSQKFDAAIAETLYPFAFGLFKAWNINTTMIGSAGIMFDVFYPMFGIPFPTSYLPSSIYGATDKMSYIERIFNIITHLHFTYTSGLNSRYITLEDVFDEKYGVGFYQGDKIMTNASFIFINTNPFLDIPSPKSPKMIEVSGIGIPKPKPVDKEFDEILNRREKTILISFGSVSKSIYMSQEMKDGIVETTKSFPDITFIWKYEMPEDGTGKGVDNLVLKKWVPQNDLLNDKRLTLFLTHGGMGSTNEVAFSNVPAIAVPIFADQKRNAKLLERLEIGIFVEKKKLSDSAYLRKKFLEILNNEKYRINSIKTATMLKNKPIGSEELLIKHVEFACRFGQLPMLDLGSKDMSFIEYYNLDIYIPFFIVLMILLYGVVKLISILLSRMFSKKLKKD